MYEIKEAVGIFSERVVQISHNKLDLNKTPQDKLSAVFVILQSIIWMCLKETQEKIFDQR